MLTVLRIHQLVIKSFFTTLTRDKVVNFILEVYKYVYNLVPQAEVAGGGELLKIRLATA